LYFHMKRRIFVLEMKELASTETFTQTDPHSKG
jgi:hypothetical protein